MHWQTHTVFNQPVPLNNSNLYLSDGALCEAVIREGAGWDSDLLASIGQQLGTAESLELGRLANAFPPELLRYDPQGQRLSLPTLRKARPGDYPPPSYPGPAGLGGNWPAGPGSAPLGSQLYSRVDPKWGPPPG